MRQRSRRTSPEQRRQTTQKLWGMLFAVAAIAILGSAGYLYFLAQGTRTPIDTANCPTTGPRFVHVILIDRSDPITPLQAARVRQVVGRLAQDSRAGERFDLYVAEGDGVNTLTPAISVCSAGRGSDANALYQNPTLIQHAFEERFIGPLLNEVDHLLIPVSRPNSPILESIRTVAITSFGNVRREGLRLTIVSDLVQHSPLNSHFRGETSFPEFQRRPQWAQLRPNLAGVEELRVLYLLRPNAKRSNGQIIQGPQHEEFWRQVFEAGGVSRMGLERL